jgi:S1-C subfamily serine protease
MLKLSGKLVACCLLATASVNGQQPLEIPRDVVAVQDAVVAAIERCEVSVVAIRGTRKAEARHLVPSPDPFVPLKATDPSGDMVNALEASFGTGVILDGRGLILTHFEVVRGLDTIEITTAERRSYPAQVVGADERSGLAVLSIQASGLPAVMLGDATRLRKGQFVVALGNPYAIAADGQASASLGIVANVGRKSTIASQPDQAALSELGWLIQTDAKLNLGTSGGALINLRGELVGLTTSLAATVGYDLAAGYAIPVDEAFRRIVDTLREGREVEYGLLGVFLEPTGNRGGILARQTQGALVREVIRGGPAERAGLRTGDVVTQVGETPVPTPDALMLAVCKHPPLAALVIGFVRDDRDQTVRVELSKAVPHGEQIVTEPSTKWRGLTIDFATAVEAYANAARQEDFEADQCVAVRHVEPYSPAWKAGLRAGSFISHIDRRPVKSPGEFHTIADGLRTGDVVLKLAPPHGESQDVTVGDL